MGNTNLPPRNRGLNLQSLTRLVVGGLLLGYDGLTSRLNRWEDELDRNEPGSASAEIIDAGEGPVVGVEAEQVNKQLLHMAVGMVFGFQEIAGRGLDLTYRATRTAGNLVGLAAGPIYQSRVFSPVRNQMDKLAERGLEEVNNWVDAGRMEERRSRALARRMVSSQVNEAIDYLTSDEEVQELVQSQSVGLVSEIVEETRERSLSADNFLEEIVRSMFRRPPRHELPPPPADVQDKATAFRQLRGRIIHK